MRIALLILAICSATTANATTYYVDHAATGASDGSSWADAWVDLQDALSVAVSGDEVWIARGVYRPDPGQDRFREFRVPSGVKLYGGFAGTETSIEDRDLAANPTVLSGDVGERRPAGSAWDPTAPWAQDNSVRLVLLNGSSAATLLDGLELSESARGMDILAGAPVVRDCVVRWNHGTGQGIGALVRFRATPTFENVTFANNASTQMYGGGLSADAGSHATLKGVVFRENSAARYGGGMAGTGSLTNVRFEHNVAREFGGALWSAGGVTGQNVSFTGNRADRGAAVYLGSTPDLYAPAKPTSSLVNLTVADNEAFAGAAIECSAADLDLTSVVAADRALTGSTLIAFTDATVTVSHSLIRGSGGSGAAWDPTFGADLGGNLDGDPGYAGADDFRLTAGSPGIDSGDAEAVAPGTMTDLDGNPRVSGPCIDMGAWEFQAIEEPGDADSLFAAVLEPRALNLKSQGRFVKLTLTAVGAVPVDDIDPMSLRLGGSLAPESGRAHVEDGALEVKFSRSGLIALLEPAATVTLDVTGSLTDGSGFATTVEIKIAGFAASEAAGTLRVFPNPFNPATNIQFELAVASRVELAIYDISGRRVKSLVSGSLPAGPHAIRWDGTDASGRTVASGTYFARVRTRDFETVGRLVLVK